MRHRHTPGTQEIDVIVTLKDALRSQDHHGLINKIAIRRADFPSITVRITIVTVLHVALYEPEIPPNTGNIARLCAATGTALHIIGVTGFRMDDRTLKRSGLDYWQHVSLVRHIDIAALYAHLPGSRFFFLTTKAERRYTDAGFRDNDCIVFGPETRGLPNDILNSFPENCLKIPMSNPNVRSLNLATSVGIVLYEALRQIGST